MHKFLVRVKVHVAVKLRTLDIAPVQSSPGNFITGTLKYGTRCQQITQLPTRLSTNGINHTCLCLPSRSWSLFTDPGGWKAESA